MGLNVGLFMILSMVIVVYSQIQNLFFVFYITWINSLFYIVGHNKTPTSAVNKPFEIRHKTLNSWHPTNWGFLRSANNCTNTKRLRKAKFPHKFLESSHLSTATTVRHLEHFQHRWMDIPVLYVSSGSSSAFKGKFKKILFLYMN